MKVTPAVDYMATDSAKPANGLPLPQQADVITTDADLEIEVGEANQQQQNPGHFAKIVTLTNGNGGIYREDKSSKTIVNGTSQCMKAEPLPGDLIVANGDSHHSTPRKLQDKTDFTANRALRYLQWDFRFSQQSRWRIKCSDFVMLAVGNSQNIPEDLHLHIRTDATNAATYDC